MTIVFEATTPEELRDEILKFVGQYVTNARIQANQASKAHERIATTARLFILEAVFDGISKAIISEPVK